MRMSARCLIGVLGAVLMATIVTVPGPVAAQAPEVLWQAPIKVYSGDGHKGPWRQNNSEFFYVDDPSPAIGEDGSVALVWVDQARHSVLFQIYDPDGEPRFDKPVDVSKSPGIFSWLPRVAIAPGNSAMVQLTLTDLNKRSSPEEFMSRRMKLDDMRNGRALTVSGLPGHTAIADGKTPWGSRPVRYAVLFRDNRAWIFAGAVKQRDGLAEYERAILDTVNSYHALTAQEKQLATGKHLKVISARSGTRYADLAKQSPVTHLPEEQLRLLNGQYPDGEPAAASLIKIVK